MESRTSATGITRPAPQSKSKPRKRANYLRHSKRCAIIKRVSNGEQQAALAREYGVTRAAVSHIYKNRVEILARSSDEESDDGNAVELAGAHNEVFLIRHDAVLVLLTSIQNVTTEPTALDRAISRLIMILIEEAIALLGTQAVQRVGATGEAYQGLERQNAFCGITLGNESLPFAVLFRQMETEAPVGSIAMEEIVNDNDNSRGWRIAHMDVPVNVTVFKILLFGFFCGTGGAECKAIEALRILGVEETSISIVVIQSTAVGIAVIRKQFPEVRIITAAIDDQVPPGTATISPGLAAFIAHNHTPGT